MRIGQRIAVVAAWAWAAFGQSPPATILEIDIENIVFYYYDVTDPARLATAASVTPAAPGRVFRQQIALGDIVAVNQKPAKGLWALRCIPLQFNTSYAQGQSIADVSGFGLNDWHFVILHPDGRQIGTITTSGIGGMATPPGAPKKAAGHNLAVVGGTGAYLGARGQYGYAETTASRAASMAEDPANRRTHPGAGKRRDIIHLIPMTWPEVTGIFHGGDFSAVTPEKPARAGEWLVLSATGLGPTAPGAEPGTPFPEWTSGKEYLVNSPLDAMIGGQAAEVRNAIGWPGQTGVYRVDSRVPDGIKPGLVSLNLSVAWIAGREVKFPVQ